MRFQNWGSCSRSPLARLQHLVGAWRNFHNAHPLLWLPPSAPPIEHERAPFTEAHTTPALEPGPPELAAAHEIIDTIRMTAARTDPRLGEAVLLLLEGHSQTETARRLGLCRQGMMRSLRALAKLHRPRKLRKSPRAEAFPGQY